MTVGGVLTEAWEYYRRFFRSFVTTAAAIFVLLDLLGAIAADARNKSTLLAFVWGVVALVAGFVGTVWVQGALVSAVDDARFGRTPGRVSDLYTRVRPRLPALLVAGLLLGIASFLVAVVGGVAGPVGVVLAAVALLFLLTRWILLVPLIVLEGLRPTDAFRRSWRLVRGSSWRVLGVVFLTLLLTVIAKEAIIAILSPLPRFADFWLGGLVADSLTAPFLALCWTVTYFELRRRETPLAAAA